MHWLKIKGREILNKAILLDRDGTINVEKNYLYKIEDFEFLPGAIDGLRKLQKAGYLLIIITNQSGIGRGYYTEEDLKKLNDWMLEKLVDEGVYISKVYYCPHLPDAAIIKYRKKCNCRKPAFGMYKQAVIEYNIDLLHSYSVGDKIRDCIFCEKTPCKGYLIGKNEKEEIIRNVKSGNIRNVRYAEDLLGAASLILEGLAT